MARAAASARINFLPFKGGFLKISSTGHWTLSRNIYILNRFIIMIMRQLNYIEYCDECDGEITGYLISADDFVLVCSCCGKVW